MKAGWRWKVLYLSTLPTSFQSPTQTSLSRPNIQSIITLVHLYVATAVGGTMLLLFFFFISRHCRYSWWVFHSGENSIVHGASPPFPSLIGEQNKPAFIVTAVALLSTVVMSVSLIQYG